MNRLNFLLLSAGLGLLTLSACNREGGSAEATPSNNPPAAAAGHTPYQVDSANVRQIAPGVTAYIVELGSGQVPQPGQEVIVNYHGMFTDGRVFDSSMDPTVRPPQPFNFQVGKGQVIQGWDLALTNLPVGTKAKLVLSPEMAYGEQGRDGIPPNSTLVFDVHLLGANPAQ